MQDSIQSSVLDAFLSKCEDAPVSGSAYLDTLEREQRSIKGVLITDTEEESPNTGMVLPEPATMDFLNIGGEDLLEDNISSPTTNFLSSAT